MQKLTALINQLQVEFFEEIEKTTTIPGIDSVRLDFLGKQGKVTSLFKTIKTLSVEEKKEFVPLLNSLKAEVEEKLKQTKKLCIEKKSEAAQLKQRHFDVTASKTGVLKGHLHPYSQFFEEIEDIFISMGYDVLDGPYVETDYYNFTALNIPEDHPARDMYDTFWMNKKDLLLRTHTSPLQVRTMEKQRPPIAAVVPGYTFRHEAVDASHDTMFAQCEGFVIGKDITLSHLFATAQTFLKALFKTDELDIRIRPGFFPLI